jgi:hypothetical protein
MKVKLKKPITVGDKQVDEIDLSKLEDTTGADIDFAVREAAAAKGEVVRVIVIDHEVHIQLAARATGIPVEALKKLRSSDYVEVATAVQNFLTGSA